jgi:uncharacterized protein (TIGR00162 family)
MVADHLIHELKPIHLADVFCTSFPSSVMVNSEGIVDLPRSSLYYSKLGDLQLKDFIFVTGDAQPMNSESGYLLAEEILNIAKKFQASHIVTLGAYTVGAFSNEPKVYFAATHREAFESLAGKNVIRLGEGNVTGMNGLILGIGKLFKMQGICLLGETSGYVIDAIASKNILRILMEITGLKVDMQDIENKAKETEKLIRTIEQQVVNKMISPGQSGEQVSKRQSNTPYIS